MFTGIVQTIGTVESAEQRDGDLRIGIDATGIDAARRQSGDSVAVAGVCLTVAALTPRGFIADVSRETIEHTTIGLWHAGSRINLEPALRAGDALGGRVFGCVGHDFSTRSRRASTRTIRSSGMSRSSMVAT